VAFILPARNFNCNLYVTRRYTPMHGIPTTVWFDRPDISPHSAEDTSNVNEMCDYLEGLVAQEWTKHGISADRVIVGEMFTFCASSLLYIHCGPLYYVGGFCGLYAYIWCFICMF